MVNRIHIWIVCPTKYSIRACRVPTEDVASGPSRWHCRWGYHQRTLAQSSKAHPWRPHSSWIRMCLVHCRGRTTLLETHNGHLAFERQFIVWRWDQAGSSETQWGGQSSRKRRLPLMRIGYASLIVMSLRALKPAQNLQLPSFFQTKWLTGYRESGWGELCLLLTLIRPTRKFQLFWWG